MEEKCDSICFMAFLFDNYIMHTLQILTHYFADAAELSEYDQEISQPQTADKLMAPGGRATQQSHDTRKTN